TMVSFSRCASASRERRRDGQGASWCEDGEIGVMRALGWRCAAVAAAIFVVLAVAPGASAANLTITGGTVSSLADSHAQQSSPTPVTQNDSRSIPVTGPFAFSKTAMAS